MKNRITQSNSIKAGLFRADLGRRFCWGGRHRSREAMAVMWSPNSTRWDGHINVTFRPIRCRIPHDRHGGGTKKNNKTRTNAGRDSHPTHGGGGGGGGVSAAPRGGGKREQVGRPASRFRWVSVVSSRSSSSWVECRSVGEQRKLCRAGRWWCESVVAVDVPWVPDLHVARIVFMCVDCQTQEGRPKKGTKNGKRRGQARKGTGRRQRHLPVAGRSDWADLHTMAGHVISAANRRCEKGSEKGGTPSRPTWRNPRKVMWLAPTSLSW